MTSSRACVFLSLPLLVGADALGADRWERALSRGEVLVESKAAVVVVKAVVEAAPERVWALVSRCGRYPRTMERIKAARELSRKADRVVCRVTVDMPFPYSDLTATTRAVHSEDRAHQRFSRRWDQIEGDYKVNRGSWELSPFNGDKRRTLVIYRAEAVPRAWVPDWIRTTAQRRSLPRMIERIRRLVAGA
jgi:ribosome-associated toxin RatA of RatAB toxin-antitoxin module